MEAWTKVFWFQNTQYRHSWLIYFKRKTNYFFQISSTNDEGYKLFQSKFNSQETCVPVMLKFFSIFSLAWVFSWQYKYAKADHCKSLPILQRHGYVKWWSQFDSSMAYLEKVREWFKTNPHSQKISDPEAASFLNQKAQIAAALAGAQSK
ncbi:hypothetical protein HN51_066157 [Arachis hypogaea]